MSVISSAINYSSPNPLHYLTNPLATLEQLSQSASALDGLPDSLADSIRYQGSVLTQAAGILLRLPQDVIAAAIVNFTRFYTGPEGGSFRVHAAKTEPDACVALLEALLWNSCIVYDFQCKHTDLADIAGLWTQDISAACLYLTAKTSATPVTPRSLLNTYAYLVSSVSVLSPTSSTINSPHSDPVSVSQPSDLNTYTLSPGAYQTALQALQRDETIVLRHISFATRTVLPHGLALTYLSTLNAGALKPPTGTGERQEATRTKPPELAARTIALLNTALMSPQRLYLTHQPHSLAVAAVYLAARQVGVPLVGHGIAAGTGAWWEIFDVDREELGFLVVAMLSANSWIAGEKEAGRGLGPRSNGRWLVGLKDVERELLKEQERPEEMEET